MRLSKKITTLAPLYKYLAIALMFFLLGFGVMYFLSKNEISKRNAATVKIIDNCVQTYKAYNTIVKSCSGAYLEATNCAKNLNTCNMDESAKKLNAYDNQRILGEELLRKANKDAQTILNSLR